MCIVNYRFGFRANSIDGIYRVVTIFDFFSSRTILIPKNLGAAEIEKARPSNRIGQRAFVASGSLMIVAGRSPPVIICFGTRSSRLIASRKAGRIFL